MKNLKQNLVRTILCLGVVSVSLIACESDTPDETNIISLDQLNDQLNELDSVMKDSVMMPEDTLEHEPADADMEAGEGEDVKNEEE